MSKWHKGIRIACLLTLVALVILSIGISYGRFFSSLWKTVGFQAKPVDSSRAVRIDSEAGWQVDADSATITFTVANDSGDTDQRVYLRLTATEGLPSDAVVTMTVDDVTYTASAEAITSGHPLYDKIGQGTQYRFYGQAGELDWPVSADQVMTISVQGDADVSLLRLTATEA